MKKKHVPQDMNQEQVQNILKFIDASQSEAVKESIFQQLGHECFYARKLDEWIGLYKEDVQAFLDRINIEKASKYWERLEFDEDQRMLILTGKKVTGCACAFADCEGPPISAAVKDEIDRRLKGKNDGWNWTGKAKKSQFGYPASSAHFNEFSVLSR